MKDVSPTRLFAAKCILSLRENCRRFPSTGMEIDQRKPSGRKNVMISQPLLALPPKPYSTMSIQDKRTCTFEQGERGTPCPPIAVVGAHSLKLTLDEVRKYESFQIHSSLAFAMQLYLMGWMLFCTWTKLQRRHLALFRVFKTFSPYYLVVDELSCCRFCFPLVISKWLTINTFHSRYPR